MMKKVMLCASAMLLEALALENINVEGMKEDPKPNNKIARYSMMVISKYFNTIDDYINIEKCCKEYNGIIEKFKYNPILFENEKERELFKNIETLCLYWENDRKKEFIVNDKRIKKFIHWEEVSYSYLKENKNEKNVYKNVEFSKEDMEKYLLDHKEDDKVFLKEENVELEEDITSIESYCLENCVNLSKITIPTSVSSIGEFCFYGCRNLISINIPPTVFSLGAACFYECSKLSEIVVPSTIVSIPESGFNGCSNLTSINIQAGIINIFDYCFSGCNNLLSIDIPTSVSSIGHGCFHDCSNLSTITIPTSVSFIGNWGFSSCINLSTITIPTSVSYIGHSCFRGCYNLSTITIPTSVSSIGQECFSYCTKLSTITIPTSVSFIGECCFQSCNRLTEINIVIGANGETKIYEEQKKECGDIVNLVTIDGEVIE